MSDKFTRFEKPTSNQDFFNKAWQWLVVENRPRCVKYNTLAPGTVLSGTCVYRELDENDKEKINGHTCVIGAFIPDDIYPGRVFTPVSAIYHHNWASKLFSNVDLNLLQCVQRVHDNPDLSLSREQQMHTIAGTFNLQIPEPQPKL